MAEFLWCGGEQALLKQLPGVDFRPQAGRVYIASSEPYKEAITAPEVAWFARHTRSTGREKAAAIATLFEKRAVQFDRATFESHTIAVGDRVLILGQKAPASALAETLKADFSVTVAPIADQLRLEGHLGQLRAHWPNHTESCDQIVLMEPDADLERFFGVIAAGSDEAALKETLLSRRGEYTYPKSVTYDATRCQYADRQSEACGLCAELCPTFGVVKADEKRELIFSDVDCMGCGGCISACPSGAIDFARLPIEAFEQAALAYESTVALLIPENMLGLADVSLPAGVLPFVIEREKFPSETQLLALLQESGSQVIFFSEIVSKGTRDAATLLNAIWRQLYGCDAVLIIQDVAALEEALEWARPVAGSRFSPPIVEAGFKRDRFATRLQAAIGDRSLGSVPNGEVVRYGRVAVSEPLCTLCMSCVQSCNTGALFGEENRLMANFSKCTQCGECAAICPEQAIALVPDGIELSAAWFEPVQMAEDDPFCCVECGEPFASGKSIAKVLGLFEGIFGGDSPKARTLRCCAECKPKVMMKAHFEEESLS